MKTIAHFGCHFAHVACFTALILFSAGATQAASPYDTAFEEVMARYRLPGLAVGIIENGKVTYMRGAGELSAGSGKPVTPDTLFKIASNSKAMTTALLARLVQAGRLNWDDPVAKYLPALHMYDPWVTRNLLVRDLLVHNAGLREGAGDLMLWPEPNRYTRGDIIAALAYLKPQASFRSGYAYDNLLYVVAGEVAAAAGGAAYEELIRREVFAPLGLSRCRVGDWDRDATGNVAQPHMTKDGHNTVIDADAERIPAITSAAAGGIRCSLRDMLTWAQNWLAPDAAQLAWLGQEQRRALWTPRTPMPISSRQRDWDHSHFYAYGFGWRLTDVDGVWSVSHTGTLGGMYSVLSLLPDQRSGFVMLTNGEGGDARTVLSEVLLKHFTAPGNGRSVAEYADELARESAAQTRQRAPDTSSRQPATAAQMRAWLGVWRDPWFGEIAICGRGAKVRFNAAKSPLLAGTVMRVGARHLVAWDNDSIDAEAWLRLAPGKPRGAATLTMAKVDPEADFSFDYEDLSFTRVHACERDQAMQAQQAVDTIMHGFDGNVPGASVLVIRDGVSVVRRGYGLADLEDKIAATPATNYRLASMTKQFTAAAILLLAEDGRLGLNDRIRQWLPSLPETDDAITIRHLLTHRGGLIDYEDIMPDSEAEESVPADLSKQLRDIDVLHLLEHERRLYFAPGTAYRYSNGGYSMLALIVERASARSFQSFLHDRIFQPLGMQHTLAYVREGPAVPNRAYGYTHSDGGWRRTDQSLTSAVLGDGGIYSSLDDLAKWDAALCDHRLLSDASRGLAFTPWTKTDEPQVDYGFGWRITGETLWHSGETIGFRNVIVRYPRQRLTVIVLSNRNDSEPYRMALAIAQYFLRR